jgi:DNA-binding CsgD family transcriptional regulator
LAAGGDLGAALAAGREGLAIAEELEHTEWQAIAHSTLGVINLSSLDAPEALRHSSLGYVAARRTGAHHIIGLAAAFLASAHLLAGKPEGAEAVLEKIIAPESEIGTFTRSMVLLAYCDLFLARSEPGRALDVAGQLATWAEGFGAELPPRLSLTRGRALAALGRTDEAGVAFQSAAEAAARQEADPLRWQIEKARGDLFRAMGRRDEAEHAYTSSRAIVERIAAGLGEEPGSTFQRLALEGVPARRTITPLKSAKLKFGGLTAREREVARLIARGLSNREIAAALLVSERTVEAHAGHIRDKLQVTSRSQVVAWAIEQLGAGDSV